MTTRPIVFLSDYGLADEFVGVCHGVIAAIAPEARIIDLTHGVPRQDVRRGAMMLAGAVRFMPEGATYLAVVDPGVGSGRRAIAIRSATSSPLVGPDNGLLSMAWAELGGAVEAVEITSKDVLIEPVSSTFHGRDVFAPAAAHLAAGIAFGELGPAISVDELVRIEFVPPTVELGRISCEVMGVDAFGNVQLNAGARDLEAAELRSSVWVGKHRLPRVSAFSEVPEGSLAAIVDSQGFVALVVNGGSAAEVLGLRPGNLVRLMGGE